MRKIWAEVSTCMVIKCACSMHVNNYYYVKIAIFIEKQS